MSLALSLEQQQEALTRGAANRAKWDQISVALAAITAHTNRLDSLAGSMKFVGRYPTKAAFETAAEAFNYVGFMSQGYTPAFLIDEGKIMAFAVNTSNPLYAGTPDFEYANVENIGFEYSAQESLDSAAISTLIADAVAPLATAASVTQAQTTLSSQIGDLDLVVQDHALAVTQVRDRVTVLEANSNFEAN